MTLPNIAQQRLANERLTPPIFTTPTEVVRWFGAVQAQEYALAKWALALRMQSISGAALTDAALEQAFNEGAILRTHVMRPTWHFVTPEDIRWMLELTAPRVHAVNAYMYRQLGLDEKLLWRASEVMVKALEGGKQLTRVELGAALAEAGIAAKGMQLGYVVHFAELEGIVCSGARRGKQFTYALIAERAPQSKSLPRNEALAELAHRFFTSHGPATVHDFAWWSGLTIADAKAGLDMLKSEIVAEEIDGRPHYFAAGTQHPAKMEATAPTAWLLPPYDEYTIAYREHSAILDPEYHQMAVDAIFSGVLMIDGLLLGNWRRVIRGKTVLIELAPFRPLNDAEQAAVATAAERFGQFLERSVSLAYLQTDDLTRWRKSQKTTETELE